MTEHHAEQGAHVLGYGLLLGVWAALMVLTAVTVAAAKVDLGFLNVAAALGIASVKALLVVFVFMHLRYETRLLRWMVYLAFVILAICIGFTFLDVGYRA